MNIRRKLLNILLLLLAVFVTGTVGYKILGMSLGKDWPLLDCAYMSIITLSTVGYDDYLGAQAHLAGRIYIMGLVVFGIGTFFYCVGLLTATLVEMDIGQIWRKRKMTKTIESMKDHFIICGAGGTGIHVATELIATNRPVVVIENDPQRVERLQSLGDFPVLNADATDDETLRKAGVERAAGLAAALHTDRDNLFITLSARQLNPRLRIVAKSLDESAAPKFYRAGASAVVSPNVMGGMRLASELIRPTVVKFLDVMLQDRQKAIRVEEAVVAPSSSVAGKSLAEAAIQRNTHVLVVAAKPPDSENFIYSPSPDTKLPPGTLLIVLGSTECIEKLRTLLSA